MEASDSLLKTLARFSLFRGVRQDSQAFLELVGLMKKAVFQARETIIDERGQDTRMFFLLKGEVQITKVDPSGKLIVLGKADAQSFPYFGESVLLGKFKKSASVVAHGFCECATLNSEDFAAFIQKHGSEGAAIYGNLAGLLFDRLAKANQDLLILSLMNQ